MRGDARALVRHAHGKVALVQVRAKGELRAGRVLFHVGKKIGRDLREGVGVQHTGAGCQFLADHDAAPREGGAELLQH